MYAVLDWYHKWVYRPYVWVARQVTDRVPFAVSDLFLWINPFTILVVTVVVFLLVGMGSLVVEVEPVVSSFGRTVLDLAIVTWVISYFVLILRRPYYRKFDLDPRGKGIDREDLNLVIWRLNELASQGFVNLSFKPEEVYNEIMYLLYDVDQYESYGCRRYKVSGWSKQLRGKMYPHMMLGMFNPLLPEVVLFNNWFFYSLAHEMAHSFGIPDEADATFVAIAACTAAEDGDVLYQGYMAWLLLLLEALYPDSSVRELGDFLGELGLNETSVGQYIYIEQALNDEAYESYQRYGSGLWSWGARALHQVYLKLTGQDNAERAYRILPLVCLGLNERRYSTDKGRVPR